jgi:NADH:ubiquinone oxidoreductase subunit F (NADH-binding)/(2Fe-2S) ferredoxin
MSLMDKCCEKCSTTQDNPCKNYIACRTAGPLCHDDTGCKAKLALSREQILQGQSDLVVRIGMSTCGLASGSQEAYNALKKELSGRGADAQLMEVGCMGMCYAEPLVEITRRGGTSAFYGKVNAAVVPKIVEAYISGDSSGAMAVRARKGTLRGEDGVPLFEELPWNRRQYRDVMANCGIVDPNKMDEYVARGGYRALAKVLNEMKPDQVIGTVKSAGLRGRGGAGFPTGMKWQFCRAAKGDAKYMICNADEGDPGAFMNRLTAEGDPHRVLEGLIIAAYAIGATHGYIFVRAEKGLMAKRLMTAVDAAQRYGLLGDNILGSGFNFDVDVMLSAGAFVCGEETAMIATIEGNRAMPRVRPPYPATSGLMAKPTTINNVETLAHVPTLITDPEYFTKVGTEKSKGTKVFCLAGKVVRTGAAEVPLGTSLRQLIFEIGGGVANGKKFKAVQTGGPSGGCLSEKFLDLPLDYESLQSVGSIMGSGGIIVLDEDSCIVDTAKYFLGFTTAESCGKCTPCRIGLKRIHEVLTRITDGQGTRADLSQLESLGATLGNTALCALGQGAPNPVLTTMKYFPEEYTAHLEQKCCPAHVCQNLISYSVQPSLCVGCGLCYKNCPADAIKFEEVFDESTNAAAKRPTIDPAKCARCGSCYAVCPKHAIVKE